MTIQLNGKAHDTRQETSHIRDLLEELELDAQPVVVEHNGNALFPRDFESTFLNSDDRVEIIRVVAGG